MEDQAIVELYWQRSDRAIAETEQKYGRYCHKIAWNICMNCQDAEECVKDTWFRAWNLMPDKRPAALPGFLGGITRNLAIDRYKTKNRKKRGGGETELALEELSDCIPAALDTERSFEQREFQRAIGSFVESLSETEQQVFTARYYFLAPVAEIGEKLHFSQSKTKSMLLRLRRRLSCYLQEEGLW